MKIKLFRDNKRIYIYKGHFDYSESKYKFHYMIRINDWFEDNIFDDYAGHCFDFYLFRICFVRFIEQVKCL